MNGWIKKNKKRKKRKLTAGKEWPDLYRWFLASSRGCTD